MTNVRGQLRDYAVRNVGGTAMVLIYHRVADLERDPQLLAVSPEHFDHQMRVLAAAFNVLPLNELVSGLRHRHVPKRAVAVTFDDGYADNLAAAEPILVAHGVPATVFASSGYVASGREFWWDELEGLVLSPGELPARVILEVPGGRFSADLGDSLDYTAADAARDTAWNVLAPDTNARQRLYRGLCDFVRPLSVTDREDALRQLRALADCDDAHARSTHRPLTADEVRRLDASPVVKVGAHTVNHPLLAALPLDRQREEIVADKAALESIVGREVSTFSYPYGGLEDYSDESVTLAREAGFAGACSNHPGVVKPWTDPFRVPRLLVRDWDGPEFIARLEGWLCEPH